MTVAPAETKTEIILLDDGNIQIKFSSATGDLFCVLTPEQAASLATNLLNGVSASYTLMTPSDAPPAPSVGLTKINATIPVQNWKFGHTASQNQKAAILQIGGTNVGIAVNDDQLREFGRTFVNVSWKMQTAATLRSLLSALLKDFLSDLRFWCSLLASRLTVAAKRRATRVLTWIRGGSVRVFRSVSIAESLEAPKYEPVHGCIYCDAQVYSTVPGQRQFPFGTEHVVAEGLGGTIELPEASCLVCERATGAVVENDVLGRTMKALRIHLNLKKKGRGPHPKTLPIEATIYGESKKIELPVEDYPIVFMMVAYGLPTIDSRGGIPGTLGVTLIRIKYDEKELFRKYRIGAFATPSWDNHMLCRMLAKIGHSFAAAELTLKSFTPLLTELIRKGDLPSMRFVGCDPERPVRSLPEALHALELGYQRIGGKTYVVARIRLFANYDSPTYLVIVGESLESPMARAKRVFSNRISRMLAWMPGARPGMTAERVSR
jgi:hypothetical protein